MDDQDMALNQEAEVETAVDATPAFEEQTATDIQSVEDSEPKKGYTARVSEAVNRAKQAEQEARSLRAKLAEVTGQQGQMADLPPYQPLKPLINPGEEVTIEEINQRQFLRDQELLQRAAQMSSLQAQQAMAIDRVNREARELTKKYAELDPNSDSWNPELSETVVEAAEAYVRANPTRSLEEFVDKQMRLYKRAATREAKAEQAEISRQSSQSAIRPTTTKPVDKKFEELSIEEMEAKLGYAR